MSQPQSILESIAERRAQWAAEDKVIRESLHPDCLFSQCRCKGTCVARRGDVPVTDDLTFGFMSFPHE